MRHLKKYTAINYKTLSHLVEYGADHTKPQKLIEDDLQAISILKKPLCI